METAERAGRLLGNDLSSCLTDNVTDIAEHNGIMFRVSLSEPRGPWPQLDLVACFSAFHVDVVIHWCTATSSVLARLCSGFLERPSSARLWLMKCASDSPPMGGTVRHGLGGKIGSGRDKAHHDVDPENLTTRQLRVRLRLGGAGYSFTQMPRPVCCSALDQTCLVLDLPVQSVYISGSWPLRLSSFSPSHHHTSHPIETLPITQASDHFTPNMSGPYDYNNQHNQGYGQNYNSQYPQGGYSQPQGNYNEYPQQGGYGAQEFGAPQRQNSYGPPQHGGFQHGQQGQQYGAYDASNPQGHAGYYGGYQNQPQQGGQQDAFSQNQAYQQNMGQHQQPQHQQYGGEQSQQPYPGDHQFAKQSSDPNAPNFDPNAPPMTEQDRGLLGAIGGGWAGHHFGGKAGHGILGGLGGAIAGSLVEDFFKDKKKSKHSNQGNSSWGGSGGKW